MLLLAAATKVELCAALGIEAAAEQGAVFPCRAHGREALALVTGIGVVNSALALGRALAGHEIDGVLDFGVAGSFELAVHPVGSVRLVERETWPEYGLLFSGAASADAAALGFAQHGAGEAAVYQTLELAPASALSRMGLAEPGLPAAQSLTVSGVTADGARAAELFRRFGAGLENMEGFALAYGARLAGLPFAELRAVSNAVGARPPRTWDLPGALAALAAAARRLLSA